MLQIQSITSLKHWEHTIKSIKEKHTARDRFLSQARGEADVLQEFSKKLFQFRSAKKIVQCLMRSKARSLNSKVYLCMILKIRQRWQLLSLLGRAQGGFPRYMTGWTELIENGDKRTVEYAMMQRQKMKSISTGRCSKGASQRCTYTCCIVFQKQKS